MSEPVLAAQPSPISRTGWLLALALFILAILPFTPALNGEFTWDDNLWITEARAVLSPDGLNLIWTDVFKAPEQKATLHYYPLVYTSFWLEYRVFGTNPLGYHVINCILHAASALVLWQLLRRLGLKAAWLAALLWAIHPIQVETVAWISERKNTLSALFAFASILMYFKFEGLSAGTVDDNHKPQWKYYALSLLFFFFALLSKTVICPLPAILFVLLWWRRKKIAPRTVAALIPMFLFGLALAYITSVQETQFVVPPGILDFQLSPLQRILLAGRNVLYYLGSQLVPFPLMPIQPQWPVATYTLSNLPILACAIFVLSLFPILWLLRNKITTGPFVAYLIFCMAIAPAIGFINFYTMLYTYVSDHYQYHASAATLTLLAEILLALTLLLPNARQRIARGLQSLSLPDLTPAIALITPILLVLTALSLFYSSRYQTVVKLWQWNVQQNDSAWMAHQNLAAAYMSIPGQASKDAALLHARRSYQLRPNDARTTLTMGRMAAVFNQPAEGEKFVLLALQLDPKYSLAWMVLGDISIRLNKPAQARDAYARAVALEPTNSAPRLALASALRKNNEIPAAIAEYETVLRIQPQNFVARYDLGNLYLDLKKPAEAVAQYQQILKHQQNNANVWFNLAFAYHLLGDEPNALRARDIATKLEKQAPNPLTPAKP